MRHPVHPGKQQISLLLLPLLAFLVPAIDTSSQVMISPALMDTATITIGEVEVIRSTEMLPRMFGDDLSGYYAFTKTTRYGIARYDRSMNLLQSSFIPVNFNMKAREIVDLVHFQDSIYLFFYTEGLKNRTLYVKNISKEDLGESEEAREIFSLPFVRGRKPIFGVELSRDRSRLLIYSRVILFSQKEGLVEMMVCKEGLNPDWINSFRFSYVRAPRHMLNFRVDEFGNAYMLDYLYDPPVPNITGLPNKLLLLTATESGSKSNLFEVEVPKMYIKDADIEPAGKDFVICSGFYSDNDLAGTVKGSFYYRLNTAYGTVQNYRDYLLPAEDFTSGESFGLFIDHLIWKDLGYSFLVAEQYLREEHRRYQDLYVCLFSPEGELQWQKIIPKLQAHRQNYHNSYARRGTYNVAGDYWPDGTPVYNPHIDSYYGNGTTGFLEEWDPKEEVQDWDYGSYALISPLKSDWIALAFNDNIKNRDPNKKKNHVFSPGRKSYLKMVQIDRYGYMKGHIPYLRDRKKLPIPLPSLYYDTQKGRVVFPAARGNNTFQMMELELSQ